MSMIEVYLGTNRTNPFHCQMFGLTFSVEVKFAASLAKSVELWLMGERASTVYEQSDKKIYQKYSSDQTSPG